MNQSFIEIKLTIPKTFSEPFGNLLVENGCRGYAIEREKGGRAVLKGYLREKTKANVLIEKVNRYVESLVKLHKRRFKVRVEFKKIKEEGRGIILTKKPVTATEEELARNSRARSAKLRAAEKKPYGS